MNLSDKQKTFALNASKLIGYIFQSGFKCTFGDAYRSPEQAKINAAAGKGIVDSLHCKRLAVDLNLFDLSDKYLADTQDYSQFGEYWESLDPLNRWGGRFHHRPDGNHFEMRESI